MMAQGGESALEPCIYTTTSTNESVRIIHKKEYAQRIYLEDGTELDVSGTGELNYTFPNAGDHKVWIEFKEYATDFSTCFRNCYGLTSIPENLFANNTAVTSFGYCFENCSGLTSIPENLFANNTAITKFNSLFRKCYGLTSIPENLFANNTAVTGFGYCFYNCSGLTSIPESLFTNNTAVTSFSSCFEGCTNITSSCPVDNDGTPIYNRGIRKPGYSMVTSHIACFRNCTKMADYLSIPSDWKS